MHRPVPAHDPSAEYRARLDDRRARLAACERRHVLISRVRLAIAASAMLMFVVWRAAAGWWYALPLAAFAAAAVIHARTLAARSRAASAVTFYERGLTRLAHEWPGRGNGGERFRPPDHPYAEDLDLFGRGSLFELLATTRTEAGERTLAGWLLGAAPPDIVRARQAAVAELLPRLDLRERIAVLGDAEAAGIHADQLAQWAHAPRRLGGRWPRVALAVLAAVVVLVPAWWSFGGPITTGTARLLAAALALEGLLALWFLRPVRATVHGVTSASRDLELAAGLLRTIEQERFESPLLVRLQQDLGGTTRPASAEIAALSRLVALLESRANLMFTLLAALIAWATQLAFALEAWRVRAGRHVPRWLEAVGEFEALVALATFAAEHPTHTFPVLEAGPPRAVATALAHPLLGADAVPNDLAVGGDAPHLTVVSGSNMSGKSTLLRALGVNVVLAEAGAPVRAATFTLTPLAVGASIRIVDSLQDGRSRFFTEITRLKRIVDLARAGEGRVLFLLDEILAGTNSHDRRQGAEAILTGLTGLGAIGLITTHDLALGQIADRLGSRAVNVHFEDSFEHGVLHFDYRLRPGVVRTSNAMHLMRSIGLDV